MQDVININMWCHRVNEDCNRVIFN